MFGSVPFAGGAFPGFAPQPIGALSEPASASDIISARVFASLTEAATAADALSKKPTAALIEAANALSVATANIAAAASIAETASALDFPTDLQTYYNSLADAANATDALDYVLYARWNYLPTVISQYANSPILLQLIDYFSQWVDQDANINQFYELMWNIETAQGYGLDVWGRIVGVNRVLQISTETLFEFDQQSQSSTLPFGGGPFYSGTVPTTNYDLSDDAFRQVILAKALSNICNGSIPAINKILSFLFPNMGNCYVTDGGNMTMTYTFGADLSAVQSAIISQTGVLPRPAGVSASIVMP